MFRERTDEGLRAVSFSLEQTASLWLILL
jgi:hypothetical protein